MSTNLAVLSGWGISAELLRPWLRDFDSEIKITLVDLPDLSVDRLLSVSERCQQLLASAPSDSYWLGWSLGGAVAIDLAQQAPASVAGVITLATNPCFVDQPAWPGMQPETFDSFLQAYAENPAKTLQRFASLQTAGAVEPRPQLRLLKAALLEPQSVLADLLELLAIDRREGVANLEVPMLSILAQSDALVPASVKTSLAGLSPNVEVTEVGLAGHLVFQDQPELLRRLIMDWLARVRS